MSTAPAPLLIEEHENLVIAHLNRPEVRNAIDQCMIDALHELCTQLEEKPRVLILIGTGEDFAAGADIKELRERRSPDAYKGINTLAFRRIRELPMPVIAALNGYTLGGGAELAYAADIRLGTPTLKIGNPEPGLGIIAAAGATWRLPQIVGQARAAQLLLTARILKAQEALEWGLVSSLHEAEELLDAALELARRMQALDPLALKHTKRALAAETHEHPQIELELQAELFESPEKFRRMDEFLSRKKNP